MNIQEQMSTVLIIDDDPVHQRIAQLMISRNHLFDTCVSHTEAGQALKFLKSNSNNPEALPDIILLDLNMPVIDGWDFLDTYDKFRGDLVKDIRIFIVTSSVDEKDKLRSQTFSFVKGFISKPLSPDIIRKTIV